MKLIRLFFIILFIPVAVFCQDYYFYHGYDYGNQASYSPLYVMANGGFDFMQIGAKRDLSQIAFANGATNVWKNISDPFPVIRQYGWKNFLKQEVFPVSFDGTNMQWVPNYQLHLIGGGMEYAAMDEWYRMHGYPYPKVLSAVSTLSYEIINEFIENGKLKGYNEDPIPDVWIFNTGGIVLFSFDNVRKFFGETLNMADWSLQPMYLCEGKELHNVGQYWSMKWKFPSSENWHLFYYIGDGGALGLSYKYPDGRALSGAVGFLSTNQVLLDANTNKNTLNFSPMINFFYDKNNSLLASLAIGFRSSLFNFSQRQTIDYLANLNVYPGFVKFGCVSPGFFCALKNDKNIVAGVTLNVLPVGLGVKTK